MSILVLFSLSFLLCSRRNLGLPHFSGPSSLRSPVFSILDGRPDWSSRAVENEMEGSHRSQNLWTLTRFSLHARVFLTHSVLPWLASDVVGQ